MLATGLSIDNIIALKVVPSVSSFFGDLIIRNTFLLPILAWLCDFYLWLYLCAVLHLLICMPNHKFASLEWKQLDVFLMYGLLILHTYLFSMCMLSHMCDHHRTIYGSWFLLSIIGELGIKLTLSGLVVTTLTCWATSLAISLMC